MLMLRLLQMFVLCDNNAAVIMKPIDPKQIVYPHYEFWCYFIEYDNILDIPNEFCDILLHEYCELV